MGTLLGSLEVTLGTLTPGQCFTRRGTGVPLGILGSLEVTLVILAEYSPSYKVLTTPTPGGR